jgi:hypothetical protein
VKFSGFQETLWWAQAWVPRKAAGQEQRRPRKPLLAVFEESPGFLLDLSQSEERGGVKSDVPGPVHTRLGRQHQHRIRSRFCSAAFGSRSTLLQSSLHHAASPSLHFTTPPQVPALMSPVDTELVTLSLSASYQSMKKRDPAKHCFRLN